MVAIANSNPTLIDYARQYGAEGYLIEMLMQMNPHLADITFIPCNMGTQHLTRVRTGYPKPVWGKLYKGVGTSKGSTSSVREGTGWLENYTGVDAREQDVVSAAEFRKMMAEEARGVMEGFGQTVAEALFYEDLDANPERFMGLAPRFNTKTIANAQTAQNVIDMGGTGEDNRSIWLIGWGPDTVTGLFPSATRAGLQRKFIGTVLETLDDGTQIQMVRENWKWFLGLSVKDWRYVVRICNIPASDLMNTTQGMFDVGSPNLETSKQQYNASKLPRAMERAIRQLPTRGPRVRPVFYMDRITATGLATIGPFSVIHSTLQVEDVGGIDTTLFGRTRIPIRETDALATNEAQVT